MKRGITDDQYSNRRIPSVKMLPINCFSYTDGMNLSVKLFYGIVSFFSLFLFSCIQFLYI
jgi:hypothetical protein